MMRIKKSDMVQTLYSLFLKKGFLEDTSKTLANVFTENTLCGVNSHGINRVSLFLDYANKNLIAKNNEPKKIETFGNIERWDGNNGPGITNAITCTNRAIEIAKTSGIGIVALRNTNHWMRGGYYGWQAADANCISILFTNTKPNMPAWGGKELRLGNNPFIVSIPRENGHVVLDMAVSQFSFGKIEQYKLKGEQLPIDGGWDNNNNLTRNPEDILASERALPLGYWKGSALSLVLDMLATVLASGKSTYKLGLEPYETGVSQVYICIDKDTIGNTELQERLLNEIIDYTHDVTPVSKGTKTYYPGERVLNVKTKNLKEGIPVNTEIWNYILNL